MADQDTGIRTADAGGRLHLAERRYPDPIGRRKLLSLWPCTEKRSSRDPGERKRKTRKNGVQKRPEAEASASSASAAKERREGLVGVH
ncbi:hypothetical protein KFK09_001711 [Dendrobium nobile]|uniref:Uncharacterized protein n=1 Tax=Dendrobium nobile TaxID=94219 RepID=A0A8T3C8Z5_DENNO|nr:hypothetical protein KFK09_001711 [Dendrobium nobile]